MRKTIDWNFWGGVLFLIGFVTLMASIEVRNYKPNVKACESISVVGCDCVGSCYCKEGGRCCEACRD